MSIRNQSGWVLNSQTVSIVLNSGALLAQLYAHFERGEEIYDLVRDYVDISQSSDFSSLESRLEGLSLLAWEKFFS